MSSFKEANLPLMTTKAK